MSSAIEIDGKKMFPIKEVISNFSYSRDYITRLARDKKIDASFVGRQWFVDADSLKRYSELSSVEAELRKTRLSAERKREKQIFSAVQDQQKINQSRAKSLHTRSMAMAVFVLGLGLVGGGFAYSMVGDSLAVNSNLALKQLASPANTTEVFVAQKENKVVAPTYDLAPAEIVATKKVAPIENIQSGILLLPAGADTSDLAVSAFSDEVEVRTAADGSEKIVRVDQDGKVVGNEISFVRVPVNSSDTPI